MSDREQREWVLGRLDEVVVKPTSESGGKGVFIGPRASEQELAAQAEELKRTPERWIAQDLVQLSTVPTAGPDGALAPRHVDLRPFAVFGENIHIVPGGLTRVALREGSMIVNSSQGGGSKDTWVLEEDADGARARPRRCRSGRRRGCPGSRSAAPGPPSSSSNSNRCWPGSPTSCTGSAASWRAPSTPRACSTASSTPTCRAAPTIPPACGCRWDALLTIVSGEPPEHLGLARRGAAAADARPRAPDVGPELHQRTPARARARCATSSPARCGRRSTPSTSACCSATSPPRCRPARTASTRTCASAAACSGA